MTTVQAKVKKPKLEELREKLLENLNTKSIDIDELVDVFNFTEIVEERIKESSDIFKKLYNDYVTISFLLKFNNYIKEVGHEIKKHITDDIVILLNKTILHESIQLEEKKSLNFLVYKLLGQLYNGVDEFTNLMKLKKSTDKFENYGNYFDKFPSLKNNPYEAIIATAITTTAKIEKKDPFFFDPISNEKQSNERQTEADIFKLTSSLIYNFREYYLKIIEDENLDKNIYPTTFLIKRILENNEIHIILILYKIIFSDSLIPYTIFSEFTFLKYLDINDQNTIENTLSKFETFFEDNELEKLSYVEGNMYTLHVDIQNIIESITFDYSESDVNVFYFLIANIGIDKISKFIDLNKFENEYKFDLKFYKYTYMSKVTWLPLIKNGEIDTYLLEHIFNNITNTINVEKLIGNMIIQNETKKLILAENLFSNEVNNFAEIVPKIPFEYPNDKTYVAVIINDYNIILKLFFETKKIKLEKTVNHIKNININVVKDNQNKQLIEFYIDLNDAIKLKNLDGNRKNLFESMFGYDISNFDGTIVQVYRTEDTLNTTVDDISTFFDNINELIEYKDQPEKIDKTKKFEEESEKFYKVYPELEKILDKESFHEKYITDVDEKIIHQNLDVLMIEIEESLPNRKNDERNLNHLSNIILYLEDNFSISILEDLGNKYDQFNEKSEYFISLILRYAYATAKYTDFDKIYYGLAYQNFMFDFLKKNIDNWSPLFIINSSSVIKLLENNTYNLKKFNDRIPVLLYSYEDRKLMQDSFKLLNEKYLSKLTPNDIEFKNFENNRMHNIFKKSIETFIPYYTNYKSEIKKIKFKIMQEKIVTNILIATKYVHKIEYTGYHSYNFEKDKSVIFKITEPAPNDFLSKFQNFINIDPNIVFGEENQKKYELDNIVVKRNTAEIKKIRIKIEKTNIFLHKKDNITFLEKVNDIPLLPSLNNLPSSNEFKLIIDIHKKLLDASLYLKTSLDYGYIGDEGTINIDQFNINLCNTFHSEVNPKNIEEFFNNEFIDIPYNQDLLLSSNNLSVKKRNITGKVNDDEIYFYQLGEENKWEVAGFFFETYFNFNFGKIVTNEIIIEEYYIFYKKLFNEITENEKLVDENKKDIEILLMEFINEYELSVNGNKTTVVNNLVKFNNLNLQDHVQGYKNVIIKDDRLLSNILFILYPLIPSLSNHRSIMKNIKHKDKSIKSDFIKTYNGSYVHKAIIDFIEKRNETTLVHTKEGIIVEKFKSNFKKFITSISHSSIYPKLNLSIEELDSKENTNVVTTTIIGVPDLNNFKLPPNNVFNLEYLCNNGKFPGFGKLIFKIGQIYIKSIYNSEKWMVQSAPNIIFKNNPITNIKNNKLCSFSTVIPRALYELYVNKYGFSKSKIIEERLLYGFYNLQERNSRKELTNIIDNKLVTSSNLIEILSYLMLTTSSMFDYISIRRLTLESNGNKDTRINISDTGDNKAANFIMPIPKSEITYVGPPIDFDKKTGVIEVKYPNQLILKEEYENKDLFNFIESDENDNFNIELDPTKETYLNFFGTFDFTNFNIDFPLKILDDIKKKKKQQQQQQQPIKIEIQFYKYQPENFEKTYNNNFENIFKFENKFKDKNSVVYEIEMIWVDKIEDLDVNKLTVFLTNYIDINNHFIMNDKFDETFSSKDYLKKFHEYRNKIGKK